MTVTLNSLVTEKPMARLKFQIKAKYWFFRRELKLEEKPSHQGREPTTNKYRTWATVVGGSCSQHSASRKSAN